MRKLYPFLIATAVALILYAATVAPSIFTFFDDSLEFQLVVPSLGIAHPTGYPLYTLLGALWSGVLFPFGNWAWRMNIFSALAAAITVGLLVVIVHTLLESTRIKKPIQVPLTQTQIGPHPDWFVWLCACVAALIFAIVPIWWEQATIAEVYALHMLLMTAILLATLAVGTADSVEEADSDATQVNTQISTAQSRTILRLAILIGLSLAHHRMTLLLLLPIFLYVLWHVPVVIKAKRHWLGWLAGLALPFLLYLYIPLRAASGVIDLNGSYQNSIGGFIAHVNASAYGTFLGWNDEALGVFLQQSSWLAIGLGCLGGLASLFSLPGRSNWLLIWGTFLISLLFGLFYKVEDVAVFLLPALLCWTIFVGGGIWMLANLITAITVRVSALSSLKQSPKQSASHRGKALAWNSGIILLFIGGTALLYNNGIFDKMFERSRDWNAHNQAVALAKVAYPPSSYVIGLEGEATAIKYMQQSEGLAENATALWANTPEERFALATQLMEQGKVTYLTREIAGIESLYSFTGEGPLVRIWPRGEADAGAPQRPMNLSLMEGALFLDGVDVDILDEAGGARLRIAYYWRPATALSQRLKLSLRYEIDGQPVLDNQGQALTADRFPLRQVTYSDFWVPNERIRDVHYLALPPALLDDDRWDESGLGLNTILYDSITIEERGRVFIPLRP